MQKILSHKLLLFFIVLFYVQLVISSIVIFYISIKRIEDHSSLKISWIKENINYENEKWDISGYNKDPRIIGNYPLYILTTEGYVLDRRQTIAGFLDSSNFKNLISFTNIKTFSSITGQNRRIFSKPIISKGEAVGVITVSFFQPNELAFEAIDQELLKNAELISSMVSVKNGVIDVSKVDERKVSYNISFLIVDKYNLILKKSTNVNSLQRIPSFIDPSYVKNQLRNSKIQYVEDRITKEKFAMKTSGIYDRNNNALGVIVVGESIEPISDLLINFILWFGLVSILILLFSFFYVQKIFHERLKSVNPLKIWFDEKGSVLHVDKQNIKISYATNQYYLLNLLFSNPTKRWETDELSEKLGELSPEEAARKIYDTMINVNKKVAGFMTEKFIINQNKTYQLNPKLPIIKSSK